MNFSQMMLSYNLVTYGFITKPSALVTMTIARFPFSFHIVLSSRVSITKSYFWKTATIQHEHSKHINDDEANDCASFVRLLVFHKPNALSIFRNDERQIKTKWALSIFFFFLFEKISQDDGEPTEDYRLDGGNDEEDDDEDNKKAKKRIRESHIAIVCWLSAVLNKKPICF